MATECLYDSSLGFSVFRGTSNTFKMVLQPIQTPHYLGHVELSYHVLAIAGNLGWPGQLNRAAQDVWHVDENSFRV